MTEELFQSRRGKPLAEQIRPTRLDEVVGQSAALGPGSVVSRRIADGRIGSLILYGPPGTGKTTIARAIGRELGKRFAVLHAAHDSVADVRAVVDGAKREPTLLFVDEIGRLGSARTDTLLRICEEGTIDFIGALATNPFHTLTASLLSRSRIVRLEPLTPADVEVLVRRAIERRMTDGVMVGVDPAALAMLCARAGGDGRRAINAVEDILVGYGRGDGVEIDVAAVEEAFSAAPINYDRAGDQHYDVISAFIKALRGSDEDAVLYYLARLVHVGEDPRFIARRLMVHASEDVGLADNAALSTAVAALHAVEHIGYPEARIVLAHAALHVARAPKSASASRGIDLALAHVRGEAQAAVPLHLRDAHYAGAAELGHVGYRYPHDDPRGWVEQEYAPGIPRGAFYQSDARDGNTYEARADAFWGRVRGEPTPRHLDELARRATGDAGAAKDGEGDGSVS